MAPKVSEHHRAERRDHILRSALQCFSEQGYEGTTIDDIVRAAGVSKGMVYTYFGSKEEIFLGIVNDRTEKFRNHLQDTFATMPTSWGKLSYLLESRRLRPHTTATHNWVTVYLEFFLSSSRDESRHNFMKQRYHEYLKIFVDVVKAGQGTGEFRPDVDPVSIAALYWAMCDGIDLHLSQLSDVMNADAIYQKAIDMVYRAVVRDAKL